MSQDVIDRTRLRHYLLGELTEEEQLAPIEERLLVDDDFFEEFQLVKDDLIDEYVKDELTAEERQHFDQHFLTTSERREHVRHAHSLTRYAKKSLQKAKQSAEKKDLKDSNQTRPLWAWVLQTPSLRFATILILVVGVGFLVWPLLFSRSDLQQGLLALKTAYRQQRPVEVRLSGFDYAPLPNTRGNKDTTVDALSRQRAERFLLDAERNKPNAESYHALGLFYLTEKKFDEAVEQFRRALELHPNEAYIHSDLGAAILEKGKLYKLNREDEKSLEAFAESLEHLNRALTLNPNLLEALFNRALCREYMNQPQPAIDDWRQYLEKDSQSRWTDEARQHLKQIESQTPKASQNKDDILLGFNAYAASTPMRSSHGNDS